MDQGSFNRNAKDNQNTQTFNREDAPAYYANPKASNFQNGQQYPLQYGPQYQLQAIKRQQYLNAPIAPQSFNNQYQNYKIHWGKVIGFLLSFVLSISVYAVASTSCFEFIYKNCQYQAGFIIIQVAFGFLYLLINAIICQLKIKNLSPLCILLVSHQLPNSCQCLLGVLAGLFILMYLPVTFGCFIYFMVKHFYWEKRGQAHRQNQVPALSFNEITTKDNN